MFIVVDWSVDSVIVIVSLLRIVRQERLIPGLECVVDNLNGPMTVPLSLLTSVIKGDNDTLHLSVLELACVHPK